MAAPTLWTSLKQGSRIVTPGRRKLFATDRQGFRPRVLASCRNVRFWLGRARLTGRNTRRGSIRGVTALALIAITAVGAALRLIHLGDVPDNPFYDAAVHTMAQSWHAFVFGAL